VAKALILILILGLRFLKDRSDNSISILFPKSSAFFPWIDPISHEFSPNPLEIRRFSYKNYA